MQRATKKKIKKYDTKSGILLDRVRLAAAFQRVNLAAGIRDDDRLFAAAYCYSRASRGLDDSHSAVFHGRE